MFTIMVKGKEGEYDVLDEESEELPEDAEEAADDAEDSEEDGEGSYEWSWKIGDERPHPNRAPWLLTASGAELKQIRELFENIPITRTTSCTWYNEMAKFIFNNLPLE